MIIDKHSYETDLTLVNEIRYILFTKVYNDITSIKSLTDVISHSIDCLSIEYDHMSYTFTIKIKKTSMRKIHGFNHNPNFYYAVVSDIFKLFLDMNENTIVDALSVKFTDPIAIFVNLLHSPSKLSNLCHVSCISDNIIVIKL